MSGRDLKKFVLDHRANSTADRLVNRFLSRQTTSAGTYKEVDYELLKTEAQNMRKKAASTLGRLKRLACVSTQGREEQLMKRHRMVWYKENQRLIELKRNIEKQLEYFMRAAVETHSDLSEFMRNARAFAKVLDSERDEFQQNTVQPLFDLRLDLQTRMKEIRDGKSGHDVNNTGKQIQQVLTSVTEQQGSVLSLLLAEQVALETELHDAMKMCQIDDTEDMSWNVEDNEDLFGVPDQVLKWSCPDESLRSDVIKEFHRLDGKYLVHLEDLKQKYHHCLSSAYGGWSHADHLHFCYIIEQYPADIPQRRKLLLDRLHREMPHLARQQLVEHEDWYLSRQYYTQRRHALRSAWSRDRHDLLTKVSHVFEEACWRQQEADETAKARHMQKQICRDLSDKVSELRQQKLELLEIKAAIESRQNEAELKKKQLEEEKQLQKRQAQRQKLDEYYSQGEKMRKEAETRDRERLLQLCAEMSKQAIRDKERVEYRQYEYSKKVQAKEEASKEALLQSEAKEQELERLREKVRVTAESNPVRMMQSTEASTAKLSLATRKELDLQQSLFPVNGYTDEQVTSDMRFRVTAALRDANMLQSDYAKYILAQIKPFQPPRRDQESTLFKN
ncbi:coiled-coil domain-containing protein 148-like [Corticium candelabrum]|uniref:coiled-coil domain-containing protein 148-like n=1 Tax=Corticium candelabrum TaxID=121492 RepID=UPI002E25568B|nr:coiled-coil domain-containing protein 148-like [Corticium candelabrum]